MILRLCVVIILITFTLGNLYLEKLEGLSPIYDNEFNTEVMSDKMIGILNYLNNAMHLGDEMEEPETGSDATRYNYSFETPWGSQSDEKGFGALRYNLAFGSYGIATAGAIYLPSFPSLTASPLKAAAGRTINPKIWSYWDTPGICGAPWKKFCKQYNVSMCEINPEMGSGWCPDPVYNENIMYSGHVSHIMSLYETFSQEYSLSYKGWYYYNNNYIKKGKQPSYYNLPKLIERQISQKLKSPISAFPCEPTMIYIACNQHASITAILYDGNHNTSYALQGNQLRFFNWIKENGTHIPSKWNNNKNFFLNNSFYVGVTQEQIETLMMLIPNLRRKVTEYFQGKDGLVGLDGWVNQWLELWRPDNIDANMLLNSAINNLTFNKSWKKYGEIKDKELWYLGHDILSSLAMFNFTISTTTSFAIAGMGDKHKSIYPQRINGALNFLDWCSGEKFIPIKNISKKPMWYYNTRQESILNLCKIRKKKTSNKLNNYIKEPLNSILNTGNVLTGISYNRNILRSLYNGTLMKNSFNNPYVININISDCNFRLARYNKIHNNYGQLEIIIVPLLSKNLNAEIIINVDPKFIKIPCKIPLLTKNLYCSINSTKLTCRFILQYHTDTKIKLCFNHDKFIKP